MERVEIGPGGADIRLRVEGLASLVRDLAGPQHASRRLSEPSSITVRVPLAIRRRPGRKTVVTPGDEVGAPVRVRADPALVKALARAFRWQRMLDDGRYGSISEMARAEKIERGYLGKMLQLTLLAPDVVEAILEGRWACELGLNELLSGVQTVWMSNNACAIHSLPK